jgi:hypothetical protein
LKKAATFGLFARFVWIGLYLFFLIRAHLHYRQPSDWMTEEDLGLMMLIMGFPSSFAVAFTLMLLGAALGWVGQELPYPGRLEMTVTWLAFVLAGYYQWFILLPKVFQFAKRRQLQSEETRG